MKEIKIDNKKIGERHQTYFIADIAANHDGNLERAKLLCKLAKDSGADAVKFQHHNCKKYVSDFGFKNLGGKFSHQSSWKKSIYETYKSAEVPKEWTSKLKEYCNEIGITMFSTPYDLEMVDHLNDFVDCYKIGSGDLAFNLMLEKVAKTKKPVMIATGASNIDEVIIAVNILRKHKVDIVLMQCNTNYTGEDSNFDFIHLNVLKTYKEMFPDVIIGLSDHTHGSVTTLGAVALGAKVIEKHFTDDNSRSGPDHPFSMNPRTWKEMVDTTRKLERSLGSTLKKVEDNEKETVVLQRRSIRVIRDVKEGEILSFSDFEFQRPCPSDAYSINNYDEVINKKLSRDVLKGDYLKNGDFK
jgi:N-acetylneuraminate synthase